MKEGEAQKPPAGPWTCPTCQARIAEEALHCPLCVPAVEILEESPPPPCPLCETLEEPSQPDRPWRFGGPRWGRAR